MLWTQIMEEVLEKKKKVFGVFIDIEQRNDKVKRKVFFGKLYLHVSFVFVESFS